MTYPDGDLCQVVGCTHDASSVWVSDQRELAYRECLVCDVHAARLQAGEPYHLQAMESPGGIPAIVFGPGESRVEQDTTAPDATL